MKVLILNYFFFSNMYAYNLIKYVHLPTHSVISTSLATLQSIPLSIEHFPVTGSGGAKLMYGGSSKKVIFK